MSSIDNLAKDLVKIMHKTDEKGPKPYEPIATVVKEDENNGDILWVKIPGSNSDTPVEKTINANPGDSVRVRVSGGRAWVVGNASSPPTDDARANQVGAAAQPSIDFVAALADKDVTVKSITAATGYIDDLYSKNITTENLKAAHAYIDDLEAKNITTDNIDAATGYIGDLESKHITVDDLEADHATINTLDANYANIHLANVDVAWIEQGNIKKAEVFDENVFDLSGNRATLSRIDASKINVANLNADNLIVRRINGQPVVGGYTLISSTSPGYESKNPQALGWYEFVNAQWVLSTDTTVDMTKAYYQEGNEVSLYDQNYIDGLESDLQQQIDGAVETFTGAVVPTLVNYPYTDWYDTSVTPVHDERAKHVGDIYYVVNSALDQNGYCYRFAFDNTQHAYAWVLIKDSDVTKALSDISELQTFESETTSWIDETDEGLETIRTNHTALSGRVDDVEATANAALPATTFETFESTTFTDLVDEVDEQSTTMTNMTTRVGLNSGGSGSSTDIVAKESALEQTVDGISTRVGKTEMHLAGMYATSSTVAGTAAKVATIVPALSNYELANGAMVTVKFTAENTAASPTLNLNDTGAKPIKTYSGGNLTEAEYKWKAGSTFTFTYNGTNWLMQDSTEAVRINNAETSITQTADSIVSLASNNSTYTKPDGTTGTNTMASAISQNANNINLKVSKNDVINQINVSTEGAQISASKVDIAGAAIFNNYSTTQQMNTAIGNAVDGIEVGGRNLLIETGSTADNATYGNHTFTNTAADTKAYFNPYLQVFNGSTYEGIIWCVDRIDTTGRKSFTFDAGYAAPAGRKLRFKHNGSTKDISVGFTNSKAISLNDQLTISFTVDGYNPSTVGGFTIRDIKLEFGNKATDWTPAPEDVKSVHTVRATGADASRTYAAILDYSTRTTILNWALESVNGIKVNDTVRVAVAVSNMNNALVYVLCEVASIDVANNKIYGYSKGLDTTIIDGGNIITNSIGANQINTSSIDIGSFGGSIGGRNLVRHSLNLADFVAEDQTTCPLTVYPESLSIKHTGDNTYTLGAYYNIPSPTVGEKYTLSFTSSAVSGGRYSVGGNGISGSVWSGIVDYTTIISGTNSVTFTVPSGATSLRIYFSVNVYNSELLVSHVKLEKGSVATAWTPAPEDLSDRERINVKNIRNENTTHTSISISGESITFTRDSSDATWGAYYDYPCEPNSYYTVSAKVEAGSNWNINFGTATSVAEGVSIWSGLIRTCNYAGVGGYYVATNVTKTYTNQKYIRVYFCSNTPNATWTLSDITIQKGAEFARSTDYITHIDNNGIRIHPSSTTNNRVEITASGMDVYKGGTNVGYFHGDSMRIGQAGNARVDIATTGVDMYGYNANASTPNENLCHIGFASGNAQSGTAYAPFYTFGIRSGNKGNYSIVEGNGNTASGYCSHAEGADTTASKLCAHAEGGDTTASGDYSHAEGDTTTASGDYSHAEGDTTTASNDSAHAEGEHTTASNICAHAEGCYTEASGYASHAGGYHTIAKGSSQTAIGEFNVVDTSSLFIVGNGTNAARSTIFKIDSSNVTLKNGTALRFNDNAGSDYSWNQIYSGTYSNTSNLYVQADGYVAFYVGNASTAPTGRMYVNYEGTSISGYLSVGDYIRLNNGKWLYGRNTSGSDRLLCGIGSDNAYFFGYGGYSQNEGQSYFDGNVVNIRSKGNVNITGPIYPSTNIKMKNNTSIQGATTGNAYKALIFMDDSNRVHIGNSDSAVYVAGTSFTGNKPYSGSDLRLKHDIVQLDDRSEKLIMSLKPFEFEWNKDQELFCADGKCFGLGAQDVEDAMRDAGYDPEVYKITNEMSEGYLTICYTDFIPHLIHVVQKQHSEIEELKSEIKAIKEVC